MESLRNYFAQVSLIDDGVRRILTALERLRLDRDTIVIYTADHGFSLGHNGIWGHGAAAFPASAHRPSYHIPLIMAGGSIAESALCEELVSQIDQFSTLAAIVGAGDAQPSLPSSARDLGPVLRGEAIPGSDAIFYEQEETRAIRTSDWLYAMRFQGATHYPMRDEIYRLTDDPLEKRNLIDVPEVSDKATELRSRITAFFETHSDPRYDLWRGGTAKSNVTYEKLWQDAWGDDWRPEFSV